MLQDYKVYKYKRAYFFITTPKINDMKLSGVDEHWELHCQPAPGKIVEEKAANQRRHMNIFYMDFTDKLIVGSRGNYKYPKCLIRTTSVLSRVWNQSPQLNKTGCITEVDEWSKEAAINDNRNYSYSDPVANFYIEHFKREIHPIEVNKLPKAAWEKLAYDLSGVFKEHMMPFIAENNLSTKKKQQLFLEQINNYDN